MKPRKAIKESLKELKEQVASYLPKKGPPKLGQRVKLIGAHPWSGNEGEVIGFETMRLFPEAGEKPKVRLENGHECFITQSDEWEPA